MTFQQLNERLRQELLRRIQRGTLSGSLISRKSGYSQPHISNFLRGQRKLSLEAMDRLLELLHMSIEDLLPSRLEHSGERERRLEPNSVSPGKDAPSEVIEPSAGIEPVPLVAEISALEEPVFRRQQILETYPVPAIMLRSLRSYCRPSRRSWQRFVAIRLRAPQAEGMAPVLTPGAVVIIDRHYTSLQNYEPNHASLYLVRHGDRGILRYLSFENDLLILRPFQHAHPIMTMQIHNQQSPSDYVVGRVILVLNKVD